MTRQELGAKLREIRLSNNLSQRELGELLHIAKASVYNYEVARNPQPVKFLQEFERLFSLPEGSLVQYAQDYPRKPNNKSALAQLRFQCGLTQYQVGKIFHVSQDTVSRIELGYKSDLAPQIEKYLRNLVLVKKKKVLKNDNRTHSFNDSKF